VDERGEVLDSASDKLAEIRRELRVAHDRLTAKLHRLVSDPKVTPMLQEPIVTQRDGRFVIPLRAEFKGRIKAVVHDQSASGATLFIEPLQVVDLNNAVRELELAERDEVRRILQRLSEEVGRHEEAIVGTVEALARLDLALAKARYAESIRAAEPGVREFDMAREDGHPGSTLRLIQARHPLLESEAVVPIDVTMDRDTYALVITGPNTGGKTVALKTAGLLALMAQCGLHLPCEAASELSVFDAVYADIGDEQSIEQSLSTFSSHVSNVIRILRDATRASLVVLDELGAGTDPEEGSALARSILDAFRARPTTTLVATHYPELKVYANATEGVRNASVEFDLETLRPTYRLSIGLPGRSNALAIATRLGLPPEIIANAQAYLSPDSLKVESLLDEIHREKDRVRQWLHEVEESRDQLAASQAALDRRLEAIESERRQILAEAREKVESELEALRQELRELRRRLAAAAQPLDALRDVERELEALEEEAPLESGQESAAPGSGIRLGDRVIVRNLGTSGVITQLAPQEAEVQVGRLRIKARLEDLSFPSVGAIPANAPRSARHAPHEAGRASQGLGEAPPLEVDLRGRMADEALEELERRLDAAYLANLPFLRIIHGKGTGRLRQVIREALKENPYVASFQAGGEKEGGEGVTVVKIALD
jgi:DNA mismatch repair protein MutS2